jgi:hypothetical protein
VTIEIVTLCLARQKGADHTNAFPSQASFVSENGPAVTLPDHASKLRTRGIKRTNSPNSPTTGVNRRKFSLKQRNLDIVTVGEDLVKPPRRVDAAEAAAKNQNAVCGVMLALPPRPFSPENELAK